MLRWLVVAVLTLHVAADPTPVIQLPSGPVQGHTVHNGTIDEFLGIPFAAPPVGQLRFANPRPAQSWTSVLNATSWAPDCAQHSADYPVTSEDCLYLNVWRPTGVDASAALPVGLYFCGGGFVHCGANRPGNNIWRGDQLTSLAQAQATPILIVTINYRVSVFGYLGGEQVRSLNADVPQGFGLNATGNQGQWDQHMAMTWTRDNIKYFGGDPSRVTIFGESAGAGSVSNHLAMEQSAGLFHGAIIESGAPMTWTSQSESEAEANFQSVAAALNCTGTAALECLQHVDVEDLLNASERNISFSIKDLAHPPWTPVVDGVTFKDDPDRLAQQGKVSRVPMIVGSNANEGTMFALAAPRNLTALQYSAFLLQVFRSHSISIGLKYPSWDYPSAWWALATCIGDYLFACPARRVAARLSTPDTPTFLYRFNYLPSYLKSQDVGVEHSAELIFVWRFLDMLNGAEELNLSAQMGTYWSSFMTHSNPNNYKLLTWPAYDNDTRVSMKFNSTLSLGTDVYQINKCDFWDDKYDSGVAADELDAAATVLRNPALLGAVMDDVLQQV